MDKILKSIALCFLFPFLVNAQYEVSIGYGSSWVDADVDPFQTIRSLNYGELSVSKPVGNQFYIDLNFGMSKVVGLEKYNTWTSETIGGGLKENIFRDYTTNFLTPHYQAFITSLNIGPVLKVYFFDRRYFIKIGVLGGMSYVNSYMNLYDSEGKIYNHVSFGRGNESSFDDTFETKVTLVDIIFQIGGTLEFGLRLSENEYLSLSMINQITDSDYIDGIKWRTAIDETNNNDMLKKWSLKFTKCFL